MRVYCDETLIGQCRQGKCDNRQFAFWRGVGLGGSGPEGRRSTGVRLRLFARALVLEDKSGERIALVVADLPHISANLHRRAAARLLDSTSIGADPRKRTAAHP